MLLQKEPELISQANEALVEHVRKNNKKWVDLMLLLGADPRAEVDIDDATDDEPTTALHEAAKYGHVVLLRRFKVDPKQDDLTTLTAAPADCLDRANTYHAKPEGVESLEYLLEFGARSPTANCFFNNGAFLSPDRFVRRLSSALGIRLLSGKAWCAVRGGEPLVCHFANYLAELFARYLA